MAPRPNLDGGGVWQGVVGGSVAGEEWTFFKSSSIMKKNTRHIDFDARPFKIRKHALHPSECIGKCQKIVLPSRFLYL